MAKLFISLFFMVLASFLLFIAFGAALDTIGNSFGALANIDKRVSQGTFNLLDESIQGLNEADREKLIIEYQAVFGPEFALVEISQLAFDSDQKKKIDANKIVLIEEVSNLDLKPTNEIKNEENTIELIFRKHLDSSLVWRIRMDVDVDLSIDNLSSTLTVKGERYFDGMFFVLAKKLSNDTDSKLANTIEALEPKFGLPLKLLEQTELSNILSKEPEFQSLFNQNKVINISQGSNYATFIRTLNGNSQALQIGPIEIPWYIRNAIFIMLFAFIFSIATALFIWLWPLWSNLLKIKNAANEFGEGNYSARIPYRKRSAIAPVAQAFNSMAERTQLSINTQKELTTAVSHELRTPVARMRFAIEMLEDADKDADKKRYLGSINEDIDDLDFLLEELLSYARFDRDNTKLNLRLEKLTPWLSNSINKLMPLAQDKSLNYQIEGIGINESAYFESRLMSRVLDNLVQNALRYASYTIEVTLSKDIEHYVLIVEDDGKGISKEDQKHIFDAFSRIDSSRDRATGGFGLGLAIVDRIIKAHQGSVEIKKSHLGGALFEVRWPINHELIEYLKMPPTPF